MNSDALTYENDLSPPIEQIAPNDWELQTEWTYTWAWGGTYYRVTVPRTYSFEPSIPRIVWPLVAPAEALTASCLHDYLYGERPYIERREREGRWIETRKPTREEADRLFHRIMAEQGHAWWRRALAHGWVRALGWAWWYDIV